MGAAARLIAAPFPLQTVLLGSAAVLIFFTPALSSLLIYDRVAIADGELWRLLTGNLVHYSASHAIYNVIAVLVAGALIELRRYSGLWCVWLVAGIAIGLIVYATHPEMRYFGGLSGIATAAIVYLCLNGITESGPWRILCLVTLVLVAAKIGAEFIFGLSLTYAEPQLFEPVPMSHAVGAAAALLVFWSIGATKWGRSPMALP